MPLGGSSNILSVAHCATRLRLTLKDPAKAKNEQEIKKINGVLGLVMRNDEYQVVIGPGVEAVYLDFLKMGDLQTGAVVVDEPDSSKKKKKSIKSVFMKAIEFISSSFVTVLPIIVAGGLINAFLIVCTTLFGMDSKSGTYTVLSSINNDEQIQDDERIQYLKEHLEQIEEAILDGGDLFGYAWW